MSKSTYKSKLACTQNCDGTCSVFRNKFICQSQMLTYQQNECNTACNNTKCQMQTFSGNHLTMPVYVCPDQVKTKGQCTCEIACDRVDKNQYVCFAEQHKQICQSKCGVECQIMGGQYVCPEKAGAEDLALCNSKCNKQCVYVESQGFQCPKSQSRFGIFILIIFLILVALITVIIVAMCYRKKHEKNENKDNKSELGQAECYGNQTFHKYNHTPGFMDDHHIKPKAQKDMVIPASISVDTVPTTPAKEETKPKVTAKTIKAQPEFPSVVVPIDQLNDEMKEIIPRQISLPNNGTFIVTGVRFD